MNVDDVKVSQVTHVTPHPAYEDRFIAPDANSLWGFDSSKRPFRVKVGTNLTLSGDTLNATGGGGGSGTVTNFTAGDLSPLFSSSVATPTTTPALTFALTNQPQKTFLSGPSSGADATPTFRSILASDIPDLSSVYQPLSSKLSSFASLANSSGWLHNDGTGNLVYSTPTYSDVGADPAGAAAAITLAGLGGVPTTRQVNGHALSSDVTVTKTDVGLGNVTNDAQVKRTEMATALGVATLDASAKLLTSQLPSIAIVEYLGSVANQAAMLALVGEQGDWCIRTDLGTTWVITGTPPSVISSWTQLSYPTAPVTSVAGRTGAVTLTSADVGLGSVENTALSTWAGSNNLTTVGVLIGPIKIGALGAVNSVDPQLTISRNINSGSGNAHCFSDSSNFARSGGVSYNSFDARITTSGSNNFDHYVGFQSLPAFGSSGVTANLYGLFHGASINAGTVTNLYGAWVDDATGAGAVSNQHGFHVALLNKGSLSNYGFYDDGNKNWFTGTSDLTFRIGLDPSSGFESGTIFGISLNSSSYLTFQSYSNSAGDSPGFNSYRGRGTATSPSAVQNGDRLGVMVSSGYDGGAFANSASIISFASENYNGSAHGSYYAIATTSNGATSRTERLRIGDVIRFSTYGAGAIIADASGNLSSNDWLNQSVKSNALPQFSGVEMIGGSYAQGRLYSSASLGTVLTAKTGSTYDFYLADHGGSAAAVLPTGTGVMVLPPGIQTGAPSGGTAKIWKLGKSSAVSPTSPNRTIELEVDGTTFYLAAKTTND